nr:MAG TPA: hypothetical protein [Bacteriophage sp.]
MKAAALNVQHGKPKTKRNGPASVLWHGPHTMRNTVNRCHWVKLPQWLMLWV